ncbi:MAG: tetratricopeptide repeat protein [Chitinophagales bacterium]
MATKRQQRNEEKKKEMPQAAPVTSSNAVYQSKWFPYAIIALFTIGIYFNTIWNKYAIDDTIVLTDNKFTLQGFQGIKDIMTHDAFVGFFGERGSKLVSGGRYRPLSIVTLAIEVQFFGQNPAVSHAVNVLLFALSCVLLFHILNMLLPPRKETAFYLTIPFITAMLYAAHPIHTEAVSNIKGRDEIMGMLLALLSLFAALKFVRSGKFYHLIYGMLVFFLALLSKENAITFMAVIPLAYYFFTKAKIRDYVAVIGLYLLPVIGFMVMRTFFTESGITSDSPEILNNPFAYTPNFIDRYPVIFYTFILYWKLLLFPHPLSHDYYYNQIPVIGWSDWRFYVSLILNALLFLYAVVKLRQKSIASFAILFYFLTFSIVSNLVFTVGVLMNERFVYMCSLGFCLLLAFLLVNGMDRKIISPKIMTAIFGVVLVLYSVKTIARNTDWVDNLTLFIVDSKTSENSSKIQTSVGGDLTKLAGENYESAKKSGDLQRYCDLLNMDINTAALPDTIVQQKLLEQSIVHLRKAIAIYKTHSNAWLLLGNAEYKLYKNPQQAMVDYENAAAYRVGGYYDAWYNMGCVQIENNMAGPAKENFLKAVAIKPDEFACRFNLAEAYSRLGVADSAIYWYEKTLELKANDAVCFYKIGTIYGKQLNDLPKAVNYINKALNINPEVPLYYEDLGVAYGLMKEYDKAIAVSQRCIAKFPKYGPAYMNLAVSYRNKGDIAQADAFQAKAMQLGRGN